MFLLKILQNNFINEIISPSMLRLYAPIHAVFGDDRESIDISRWEIKRYSGTTYIFVFVFGWQVDIYYIQNVWNWFRKSRTFTLTILVFLELKNQSNKYNMQLGNTFQKNTHLFHRHFFLSIFCSVHTLSDR